MIRADYIKNIAVGISGGVDSAVTAFLLKQKGFNITGVFMQNWDIKDENGVCSSSADYADAQTLCQKLNIHLHFKDFVKQYWNEVFSQTITEYESGLTPNPDILCNRHIKFNYFFHYALNELKCDAIATGHYAKSSFGPFLENFHPDEDVRLLLANDMRKDQTFFLSQINQNALRRTMFPIGNLTKFQVKEIANKNGLGLFAKKKESMGICFIGRRNFQDFIKEYVNDKEGDFVNIDTAEIVGKHNGVHQWTLGQRSRLETPLYKNYVVRKDVQNNIIYVADGTHNSFLYTRTICTAEPHWIRKQPEELKNGGVLNCLFKFQHSQLWTECRVFQGAKGLIIELNDVKRAVTGGQFAVLAKNGECLGGAKIVNAGVSEFSLNYAKLYKNKDFKRNVNERMLMCI